MVALAADFRVRREGDQLVMATPWTGPLRDLLSQPKAQVLSRCLPCSVVAPYEIETDADHIGVGSWRGLPPFRGALRVVLASRRLRRGPVVCCMDFVGMVTLLVRPASRGSKILFARGRGTAAITFVERYPKSVLHFVDCITRGIQRAAIRRASCVVVVSQELAETLNVQQAFTAPEIDWSSLSNPPRHAVVRREDAALFVGRLELEKDAELAIRAAAASGTIHQLTVVGSGTLQRHLQDVARNVDAHVKVRFVPHLPHEEVLRLAQSVRVLLVPSLSEGFGLAAFEAAAMGAAVVASNVGGLPEAVDWSDGANLMSTREPAAWGKAIDASRPGPVMSPSDLAAIQSAKGWWTLERVIQHLEERERSWVKSGRTRRGSKRWRRRTGS